MTDVIQITDIVNLLMAMISLVIAIVALRIANRVAAMSISRPFIIETLYDLYEYIAERRPGSDPIKEVDRLADELKRIRRKRLILELAGFGRRLDELEERRAEFTQLATELKKAGEPSEEQAADIMNAAAAADRVLQSLMREIEPQLRKFMKNPLRDVA